MTVGYRRDHGVILILRGFADRKSMRLHDRRSKTLVSCLKHDMFNGKGCVILKSTSMSVYQRFAANEFYHTKIVISTVLKISYPTTFHAVKISKI